MHMPCQSYGRFDLHTVDAVENKNQNVSTNNFFGYWDFNPEGYRQKLKIAYSDSYPSRD